MTLALLLCLLFVAACATGWGPALVQPATLEPTHSSAAEPRTKGVRMDCIGQRTTCTEWPADECRPLTGDCVMPTPYWPFSLPLTPLQQARIEAQRRAIFGDER